MRINRIINNKLIKDTGIYTLTSITNSLIPFVLLPVLTKFLSPEDYGIVSMFTLLITFMSPFVGVNIHGALTRRFYDGEKVDFKSYIFNSLIILLGSSALVGVVLVIFGDFISTSTSFPKEFLLSVLLFTLALNFNNILLSIWQVEKKPIYFGSFTIIKTLLNILLSLVLIIKFNIGWQGRIIGQTASEIIFALLTIYILKKKEIIKFRYNFRYIRDGLKFGLPLVPHALSGSIISMTDRLFITNMVGLATTGIYTVGYQIGSIINLVTLSFNNAFVPWLYNKLKDNENNKKKSIVKFTYIYFVSLMILAIITGFLAPYLLNILLDKSYNGSSAYVIWIALGYAFNGMYLMVVNYIFYAERNGVLASITFITALLNIILNYFLIRIYGAIGAAIATTIVFFIKFISVWVLSSKVYPMPWNIIKSEGML